MECPNLISAKCKAASFDAVCFDFDGTLADTLEYARQAYNDLASSSGWKCIEASAIDYCRRQSMKSLMKWLGLSLFQIPSIVLHTRRQLRGKLASVEAIKGMPELIAKLFDLKFPMAIVTSNDEQNVRAFLEAKSIQGIVDIRGTSLFGKHHALKGVCKILGVDPKRCLYVGDEVRDLQCARRVGFSIASVTWGFNDRDSLDKASPDYLIDEAGQLLEVLVPELL